MANRIGQVLIIIAAAILVIVAAALLTKNNNYDLWLDASNFVESNVSKKFNHNNPDLNKNDVENSFLVDNGFSNYGLYKYKKGQYDVNKATFNGNAASYDKVTNDAVETSLWRNDFSVVELVIKTKNGFNERNALSISIDGNLKSTFQEKGLIIQTGFIRYVGAAQNPYNTGIGFNAGTTQPLFVPDAITSSQHIDMKKLYIYIYRIRINRTCSDPDNTGRNLNVKVLYDGKKINDNKEIIVKKVNKELPSDCGKEEKPSFNILNYPNALPAFYNDGYLKENNRLPIEDDKDVKGFDPNDRMQFVKWNWNKYWKKEYETNLNMFGEGGFFLADILHDGNSKSMDWSIDSSEPDPNKVKYTKSNLWDTQLKNDSWFYFKIKDGKMWASRYDWEPFDYYVFKMRELGFQNLLLADFMFWSGTSPEYFYNWNSKKNKWEIVSKSIGQGDTSKLVLEAWTDHIIDLEKDSSNYRYNWVKSNDAFKHNKPLKTYFYFDESNVKRSEYAFNQLNAVKENNPELENYLKVYFAVHVLQEDKSYKWIDALKDVDQLYLNNQSMYNTDNKKIRELIKYRNSKNLLTGQYQLDSHSEYDLLRADPGSLDYEMMLLNNENEPHYMKYDMNEWSSIDNYYTGDRQDDASGDTMWEYPSVNSFSKIMTDKFEETSDQSERLEQLAQGVNMVKKINILGIKNDISKYILPIFTGSRVQSSEMFNFEDKDVWVNTKNSGMTFSYIASYLKQLKAKQGEIDAVRVISAIINEKEKGELK